MSSTNIKINPLDLNFKSSAKTKETQGKDSGDKSKKEVNAILLAYMMIVMAVSISTQTAQVQSKSVLMNGQMQDNLIGEAQQFNYEVLTGGMFACPPSNVALSAYYPDMQQRINDAIGEVDLYNTDVSGIRDILSGAVSVAKQTGQAEMAEMNDTTNSASQAVQVSARLLNVLFTVTNKIGAM